MKGITSVDGYIAGAPRELRAKLREMRAVIRAAAPGSHEKISYRMPYYHYKGRLAYFAYFKHHIGLYIPTPVVAQHRSELKDYVTAAATVQFPHEKKLPRALIRKLVRARVAINDRKDSARK
jgi:uncharacterized protein YdhG (YjbR/CyaY superfamily)